MRLVVLGLFAEVFCEVAEDGCGVGWATFKCCNAPGAPPTGTTLHTNDNVLIEESAFLQKTNGRFGSEFIGSEFANADEIAEAFSLLGFSKFKKRIQAMDFAFRRWFAVLRQRFKLGFHEFSKRTIFKAIDYWAGAEKREKENAAARHNTTGFIDLSQQCCFFD